MKVVTLQCSSLKLMALRQHILRQLKDNAPKGSTAIAASAPEAEATKARTIPSEFCTLPSGPEIRDLSP